jgi:hypothetical protein
MTNIPTAVDVNCETGEVTTRPLTDAEIAAQVEASVQAEAERVAAEAQATAVAEAKASAHDKLAALGLTAEEIAALSK